MRTHPTNRHFKPALEVLEGRELPSGLLPTLQNLNSDLNTANSNFTTNYNALTASQSATSLTTPSQLLTQYSNATANWQRMISDQAAINNTGSADISFVDSAAYLYATQTGNSSVYWGTVFFVNPLFQNVINTANNTVASASGNANATFNFTTNPLLTAAFPGTTPSIASHTATT
jgi:hypothetical protein